MRAGANKLEAMAAGYAIASARQIRESGSPTGRPNAQAVNLTLSAWVKRGRETWGAATFGGAHPPFLEALTRRSVAPARPGRGASSRVS
jgi:hypothetical protein